MTTNKTKPSLASQWKLWGVGFNVSPCKEPVNLEQLLVETAQGIENNARLLVMSVTWLTEHHDIVQINELTERAEKLRGRDSACLGLILETAQEFIGENVFDPALSVCQPLSPPEPLLKMDRERPAMTRLAKNCASDISRKWGLWTAPIESLKAQRHAAGGLDRSTQPGLHAEEFAEGRYSRQGDHRPGGTRSP